MRSTTLILVVPLIASSIMAQTRLTAVPIASGFADPLYATALPGDPDRLFVVEQSTGKIRIARSGQILPTPFLNIRSRIVAGGERGLLGLAFHPHYADNGYFYVNYTRSRDGATIVERFTVSSNPDIADVASGLVILGPITQPYPHHNGGCLQFGPDGYLYIGTGDGGNTGDPGCRAQDGQSLLGKILRLDVDAAAPYIPPSNPFVGNAAFRDEIWSYGLRNPWRFSFDRSTGDMWIGDVGQDSIEEVDFQPAASAGGENYGWKIMEGHRCYSRSGCPSGTPRCNDPSLELPIQQYTHSLGCAVTGGFVYRGMAIPDLRGTYFYGDFCTGRIWAMRYDGRMVTQHSEVTAELRPASGSITSITSFGEDADGELLIVSQRGTIWKVVARGVDPATDLGYGTPGTGGRIPRLDFHGRLDPGAMGELHLTEAAPGAASALLFSNLNNPTQIAGIGMLVPYPVAFGIAFVTDPRGEVAVQLGRVGPPGMVYSQWVILDRGAAGSFALSNALAIRIP